MARTKLTDEQKQQIKDKQEAEAIEKVLQSSLEKFIEYKENFENPTRTFKVGDKWDRVNSDKSEWHYEIVESYENGLFYKVREYGTFLKQKELISHDSMRIVSWLDLKKQDSVKRQENFNTKNKIRLNFHSSTIENLLHKHYFGGIDYNAFYQRGDVWSLGDKEYLLDSIFKSIDIGKFVFIKDDTCLKKNHYEILDGKQKMLTIVAFYEDRLRYNGYLLSELSSDDRRYFLRYDVSVADTYHMTNEERKELFVRLNTAGKSMTKEHLDKVISMESPKDS